MDVNDDSAQKFVVSKNWRAPRAFPEGSILISRLLSVPMETTIEMPVLQCGVGVD